MAEPQSGWSYRLSPRLVLCTRVPQPAAAGERVILVEGGGAFPPGHPTTRLCLDLLKEALAAEPITSLLDLGCGAGALSLAAVALGAERVVAVDLAPAAARATCENAQANGLAGAILAVQGSTECLRGPFDLIMANLPWEVQLDKTAEIDRLGAAAGRLILSGFRDNQEEPLRENYARLGWALKKRLVRYFHHPELPKNISFNWVAWRLEK